VKDGRAVTRGIEGARDVGRAGHVAFDQLDVFGHRRARRRVEVVQANDTLTTLGQLPDQRGADIAHAGHQRGHGRAF
jgi:hypothetical protein